MGFADVQEALATKCRFFIFLSSIQVYDVNGIDLNSENTTQVGGGFIEDEGRRPAKTFSPLKRQEINQQYPVGHGYLEVEESLEKNLGNVDGFSYAVLRVGNVIGPRETLQKQWLAQLWVHGHQLASMPLHVTTEAYISFTYAYDIARVVAAVVKRRHSPAVRGAVFNVACSERFTQREYFHLLADVVGLSKLQYTEPKPGHNASHMVRLFPENRCGNTVSVEKMEKVLKTRPTSIQKAVRQTALFYEQAMVTHGFSEQRRQLLEGIEHLTRSRDLTGVVRDKFRNLDREGTLYEYDPEDYEEELQDTLGRSEL